jgi:gamma-glutamyltranspeptidase/glutathione hydrolase
MPAALAATALRWWDGGSEVLAVNGAGAAPRGLITASDDGANSVTVPGLAGAWEALHTRWGRLPLPQIFAPAIRLAEADWALLGPGAGERFVQPELAKLLRLLGEEGPGAFYTGPTAAAIVDGIARHGGTLDREDMRAHHTEVIPPLKVRFGGAEVIIQPPPTQGGLLAMALRALDGWAVEDEGAADHLGVELTEAAFLHRDDAGQGEALMSMDLDADPARAAHRGGPRDYLHTAGVATPGADGQVQTLLQIIHRIVKGDADLASAIAVPRWRSENGSLLIEEGRPSAQYLERLGHAILRLPAGEMRFGAIACAGVIDGAPITLADWRRENGAGVA